MKREKPSDFTNISELLKDIIELWEIRDLGIEKVMNKRIQEAKQLIYKKENEKEEL